MEAFSTRCVSTRALVSGIWPRAKRARGMGLQSPVSRAVPAGRVARHERRTLRWSYGGGGACVSSLTGSPSRNYVVVLAGALGVFPVTEGLVQMRYPARTLEVTAAFGLRTSERLDVHAGCAASRTVPSAGLHVASHHPHAHRPRTPRWRRAARTGPPRAARMSRARQRHPATICRDFFGPV